MPAAEDRDCPGRAKHRIRQTSYTTLHPIPPYKYSQRGQRATAREHYDPGAPQE